MATLNPDEVLATRGRRFDRIGRLRRSGLI
jgi:hypothetical protein